MLARLVSLFLLVAVALSGLITPSAAFAHAGAAAVEHLVDHADEHADAVDPDAADGGGMGHSHTLPHHHCLGDIARHALPTGPCLIVSGEQRFAVEPRALTSRTVAPPTQPPSA